MSADPSVLAALKAAARQAAYERRRVAHADGAAAASEAAALEWRKAVRVSPGDVVAGYRPIRTELDPTALMRALHAEGARLCTPRVEGEGRPLTFLSWTPDSPMTPGAFGAEIPANGAPVIPNVLIVPLLAFDRRGGRLGYGGGFYDRSLAQLRASDPSIRAIGFAYAAQESADPLVLEPTDQTLDGVVTERRAIFFSPGA